MLQKFLGHYSRMFDKTVEQLCSIAIQKNDNSEMTSSISLINDEHTSAYAALKVIKSNIVEADSGKKKTMFLKKNLTEQSVSLAFLILAHLTPLNGILCS